MRKLLLVILSLIFLWSCNEGTIGDNNSATPVKLRLSGDIGGMVVTRATHSGFTFGDTIKLYIVETNRGDFRNAREYFGVFKSFEEITLLEDVYYPVDDSGLDILAFYPHNIVNKQDSVFMADCLNYKYDTLEVYDLLSAKLTRVYKTQNTVKLSFSHILSMVEFNIMEGSNPVDSILLLNTRNTCLIDGSGEVMDVRHGGDNVVDMAMWRGTNRVIIPSQTLSEFEVLMGGTFKKSNLGILTEPGKITKVNLKVTNTEVKFKADIKPWEGGMSYNEDIKL